MILRQLKPFGLEFLLEYLKSSLVKIGVCNDT